MNRKVVGKAFYKTIPVLAGYVVLGIGFGILLRTAGYGVLWAFGMSAFIYAGSMQYVGVELIAGGASVITTALTTLMVNARHLFYSISMIDRQEMITSKITEQRGCINEYLPKEAQYSYLVNLPEDIKTANIVTESGQPMNCLVEVVMGRRRKDEKMMMPDACVMFFIIDIKGA